MKTTTFLLLLIFSCSFVSGQETTKQKQENNGNNSFIKVEQMPSYPGGEGALFKYLSENIQYPEQAKSKKITGKVYLTFVIDATGEVKDVKILRGVSEDLDNEAMRVIKAMPRWTPGMKDGTPVAVHFNLPVDFKL